MSATSSAANVKLSVDETISVKSIARWDAIPRIPGAMSTPKIFEAAPTTAVRTSALPAQAMLVLEEAGSWPAVFDVFEGFDAAIRATRSLPRQRGSRRGGSAGLRLDARIA